MSPEPPSPEALLLTPGAGGSADHATLIAIEDELKPFPVVRYDFEHRRAGKKGAPRAEAAVREISDVVPVLEGELGVAAGSLVLGGRSFGGRVCSMAVADGLPAAGLVLLSYPLHPPGRPERLRVDHFSQLELPVLFVSGGRDPFGSPDEFAEHVQAIPGPVTTVFFDDGAHDPKNAAQRAGIVSAVSDWLASLSSPVA